MHRIHYAGDLLEVMLNVRQWNQEMATTEGAKLWGRRTITYFVYDPYSGDFAPSKFCAYVPVADIAGWRDSSDPSTIRPAMTLNFYVKLDITERTFDGARAREHLTERLAMAPKQLHESLGLARRFAEWHKRYDHAISLHPSGPVALTPPSWFAGAL